MKLSLWAYLKSRVMLWWWILKYGGKDRIPPEVIMGPLQKAMDNFQKNLLDAQRSISLDEMTEEERLQFREIMIKVGEMREEVKHLKPDTSEGHDVLLDD